MIKRSFNCVVMVLSLLVVHCANAQTNLVFDTNGNIVGNYVGSASKSADWFYSKGAGSTATAAGVDATTSGSVLARGLKVPISAVANVAKARVAGAAMSCFTSPLGAAICVATVAQFAKELPRYKPCPSGGGGFYCDTQPAFADKVQGYQISSSQPVYPDEMSACVAFVAKFYPTYSVKSVGGSTSTARYCLFGAPGQNDLTQTVYLGPMTCPAGYADYGGTQCGLVGTAAPPVPVTTDQMQQTLQQKMDADAAVTKRMFDAMKADQQAATQKGAAWPSANSPADSSTPLSVSAPPVTGPKTVTNTKTIPNTDGSTSTEKTEQQTTVSPTTTGTTVGDSKTTFPSVTTTTITTTNNTTNASTVTTNVSNNPAPEPLPLDLPTDYNREATQKQIADSLDSSAAPTLPDQSKIVTDAGTNSTTQITQMQTDAKTGQADKSAWFSWVWTPPVGSCSPFSGSVHGYAISWDVCPTVANIKDVLGWLFALFGALEIYGQLFKRGE